jgi:hypothetical protein
MTLRIGCILALFLSLSLRGSEVLDWNDLMLAAIRIDNTGPTLSTRNLAILHLAIYDAVNSVNPTHQPFRGSLDPGGEASPEAAVCAAGHEVMLALYPPLKARTQSLYEEEVAGFPQTAATTNGLALGAEVARQMLESRDGDGSSTLVTYIPNSEPGQWRRTPPFYRPPLDPHWRYVTLFALPDKEAFVPPPPPPLTSQEYADAFNEVKAIGRSDSTLRTPEQSQIAVFWSDFSYTAMPPGHWHEIAATIVRNANIPLPDTARLFALLSLAQADAAIVCWEAKYRHNTWRPVTAIQRADEDGNPATEADPTWSHYLNSPPFPEYTSGHSTFSKASAQVLTHFLGTDAVEFSATSDSLPGVFRHFTSLAACADEVGMSRIYGGIHFQFANRAGKKCGQKIGDYVSANYLLATQDLPFVRLESVGPDGAAVRVHGNLGRVCVVEGSPDLVHWSALETNTGKAGGFLCVEKVPTDGTRFYRALER